MYDEYVPKSQAKHAYKFKYVLQYVYQKTKNVLDQMSVITFFTDPNTQN